MSDRVGAAKTQVALGAAALHVQQLLQHAQAEMLDLARRDRRRRTRDVTSVHEAREACSEGWAVMPWRLLGPAGEAELALDGVSVRCLTRLDETAPADTDEPDLMAVLARGY